MKNKNVLNGKLDTYYETGYEGSIWAFYEDGKSGYDALHVLKNGDLIKVFDNASKKEVVFEGVVDLISPDKFFEGYVPNNIDEREWAEMFKNNKPAELIIK